VTAYGPAATAGTENDAESVFPIIEQLKTVEPKVRVHGLSFVKNPEPVTATEVKVGPEEGLRASKGGRTVKVVAEWSPVGMPVTVIVYELAGTFATTNEPVAMPFEIVQDDGAPTGVPDTVQDVSLGEKPDPQNEINKPTWDDVKFSMSGFRLTLKRRSPVLLVRIALSG
jgi:hypothetical protein